MDVERPKGLEVKKCYPPETVVKQCQFPSQIKSKLKREIREVKLCKVNRKNRKWKCIPCRPPKIFSVSKPFGLSWFFQNRATQTEKGI